MAKARSGGGITSNKYVTGKYGKVEPKAKAMSVERVAQFGEAIAGFRAPNLIEGRGYEPQPCGPTGIGRATRGGPGPGPGGGNRITYGAGSQGLYQPVAKGQTNRSPDPSSTGSRGRDIIREFGPDAPGKGRR
jgi:hypothetical protein